VHRRPRVIAALTVVSLALLAPGTASADHTNPNGLLSPVIPQPSTGAITAGEGRWNFISNLGPMQGTDLEFFKKKGIDYVSVGTLGQAPSGTPAFVGQRIVQLTDTAGGEVKPKVVADHGSSRCDANSSATGLQHDVQAVPAVETELLIDTTDAVGRCHDTPGGGLEFIDISDLGKEGFEPREIALMRFNGQSHTVTADQDRPGILYNNPAEFGSATGDIGTGEELPALSLIDVIDARSCLGLAGKTLEQKRALCKPVTYRIDYKNAVSAKLLPNGKLDEPSACHDITYSNNRLYCGGLNASFIVDVTGMFDSAGNIKGKPLPCTTVPATRTKAMVTDCALRPEGTTNTNPAAPVAIEAFKAAGSPQATGWKIVTTVNHPGRNCSPLPALTCNTNTVVRSDEGVAVSHENDPALGGKFMFVTDERGGGVVPPGATCSPGLNNPVGNGGLHVFDVSNPAKPVYAEKKDGKKAIFISTSPTPSPTFCTIHVIEHVPGKEARLAVAYYDGGTKIVDYFVDAEGKWSFKETAAYRLPGANTWASEVFKVVDNKDGTNTYFFVGTNFTLGEGTSRGIDVYSWTGPPNPISSAIAQRGTSTGPAAGAPPAGGGGSGGPGGGQAAPEPATGNLPATGADTALAAMALLLLPLAYVVRRFRRKLDVAV
jgi:hypothetical protein